MATNAGNSLTVASTQALRRPLEFNNLLALLALGEDEPTQPAAAATSVPKKKEAVAQSTEPRQQTKPEMSTLVPVQVPLPSPVINKLAFGLPVNHSETGAALPIPIGPRPSQDLAKPNSESRRADANGGNLAFEAQLTPRPRVLTANQDHPLDIQEIQGAAIIKDSQNQSAGAEPESTGVSEQNSAIASSQGRVLNPAGGEGVNLDQGREISIAEVPSRAERTSPTQVGRDVNSSAVSDNPKPKQELYSPGKSEHPVQPGHQSDPESMPAESTSEHEPNKKEEAGTKDSPQPQMPAIAVRPDLASSEPGNLKAPETPREIATPVAQPADTSKLEIKTEINSAPPTQPTREISLRLPGTDAGGVDLKVIERDGKIHVSVRTSDQDLTSSLQADLGDLVGRLQRKGFETETVIPPTRVDSHPATVESSQSSFNQEGSRDDSGSYPGGNPQQGHQKARSRWFEEWEQRNSD